METALALASSIRRIRESQAMTQQQLAELAGLPAAQSVSDIELQRREVKAFELARIARALHTPVEELLGLITSPAERVLWRRAGTGRNPLIEAKLLERARRFALLERWCDLPPAEPLPDWELDPTTATRTEAENFAVRATRILELGSRPTSALLRILEERFGVKVFYEPMGEDGSAASVRGQFGSAMLINANEAPWRRNFNVAHELFHLLTWTSVDKKLAADGPDAPWCEEIEKLANVFASRLLLPADPLLSEFGARLHDSKIKYLDIVELAREFDVSSSALVWRLVSLGRLHPDDAELLLDNAIFRAIDRGTMAERWGDTPHSLPDRFVRLAHLAYQKRRISRAKLAEFLETSLSELDPGLEIEGAGAAEAVVLTA